MNLRVTNTNAGDDSSGKIWGVEGDNIFILLIALVVGIGFASAFRQHGGTLPPVIATGAMPPVLASLYVFLLRQGKPPGFDRDYLEQLLTGTGWEPPYGFKSLSR